MPTTNAAIYSVALTPAASLPSGLISGSENRKKEKKRKEIKSERREGEQQGQKHGYPSRVWVDRSSDKQAQQANSRVQSYTKLHNFILHTTT